MKVASNKRLVLAAWLLLPFIMTLNEIRYLSRLTGSASGGMHHLGGDLPAVQDDDRGLSSVRHRYYMYNASEMLGLLRPPATTGYYGAVWSMHEALAAHPLRTMDPNEATFFLPPVYVNGVGAFDKKHSPARRAFMTLLDLATAHPIYQKTLGARHILIAIDGMHFSWWGYETLAGDIKSYRPEWMATAHAGWWNMTDCTFEKWTARGCLGSKNVFRNVILARDRDMWEAFRMHKASKFFHENGTDWGWWTGRLRNNDPMTRHGFSFGLMEGPGDADLVPATWEKHAAAEYVFFYHSRREKSGSGSTPYRHAPIEKVPANGTEEAATYHKSSIGFDIDPKDWIYRYPRSKFCLVIRGDNPISRALLRSIRVGCIPVVISDLYPRYAPSYKSTLNMSEYTILVEEAAFLENPWRELHRIHTGLSEADVRRKLRALAFAQRVIFPDAANSLFVPAFLREAWASLPESERRVGCGGACPVS